MASGYTKPNKRRATLHKQKQEWRERDEKIEKKSIGYAENKMLRLWQTISLES